MTGSDPYWYEGGTRQIAATTLIPFYISHIPKTGITSLFQAYLRGLMKALSAYPWGGQFSIARMEDPAQATLEPYALVVSMLPFGFHRTFGLQNNFKPVTILRDPYARTLSHYTYTAMRAGQKPDLDGFRSFFQDNANQNVITKHLAGLEPQKKLTAKAASTAMNNLKNEFSLYGPLSKLGAICSEMLKANGLPSVISEALNPTLGAFKLDGSAFKDEVEALNAADRDIFQESEAHPRLKLDELSDVDREGSPDKTLLLVEVGTQTGAGIAEAFVQGMTFNEHIKNGRLPRALFDEMTRAIPRT